MRLCALLNVLSNAHLKSLKSLTLLFVITVLIPVGALGDQSDSKQYQQQYPPFWNDVSPLEREVATKYGSLRGIRVHLRLQTSSSSSSGLQLGAINAYLGIPYATPPVADLRFMPPITLPAWQGTKMAAQFGPTCMQTYPRYSSPEDAMKEMPQAEYQRMTSIAGQLENRQSEDCLYLNLYVPLPEAAEDGEEESEGLAGNSDDGDKKPRQEDTSLPVMVLILGDGFEWSASHLYDGSVLASYGRVIVVTFNFRLGRLGFLKVHEDPESRVVSNLGLLDQLAALHWVQENIAHFGGNPRNVTLVGQGHGAAHINYLIMSPTVIPGLLFQRAILMSGSALSNSAIIPEPFESTLTLATALNCSTTSPDTLTSCLRAVPADKIMNPDVPAPRFQYSFGPIVDRVLIGANRPEEEVKARFKSGTKPYDIMLGLTGNDAFSLLGEDDISEGLTESGRDRVLRTYVANNYDFHWREIFAAVTTEYTDWYRSVQRPSDVRNDVLDALGDAVFGAPSVRFARIMAEMGASCYFYHFNYQASSFPRRNMVGSVFGDDIPFITGAPFVDTLLNVPTNFSSMDRMISEILMTQWTNFAKSGNPNFPTSLTDIQSPLRDKSKFKNVDWPAFDLTTQKYLEIDPKGRPRIKSHYHAHRLALWLNLIPEIHAETNNHLGSSEDSFEDPSDTFNSKRVAERRKENENPLHHLFQDFKNQELYSGRARVPSRWKGALEKLEVSADQAKKEEIKEANEPSVGESNERKLGKDEAITGRKITRQGNWTTFMDNSMAMNPDDPYASYSTALSVTIAIGCSLLILNVLIFAGVYNKRDRSRVKRQRALAASSAALSRDPSRDSQLAGYAAAACAMSSGGSFHQLPYQSPRGTLRVTRDGVTVIEKRTRFADEVALADVPTTNVILSGLPANGQATAILSGSPSRSTTSTSRTLLKPMTPSRSSVPMRPPSGVYGGSILLPDDEVMLEEMTV